MNHFSSTEDYISFLIDKCGLGIVPFEYFGSKSNKGWFRISVGNVNHENIEDVLAILKNSVLKSHSHMNSVVM